MKAMWSAASGMKNMQLKIDNISNNIANVNTVGFKSNRLEFKDLIYERLLQDGVVQGEGRPVPVEIGHGVMSAATLRSFTTGALQHTENMTDLAITGRHFFEILDQQGNIYYTKDGSFKLSPGNGGGLNLVTSEGYFVQGNGGNINFGDDVVDVKVDTAGRVSVKYVGNDQYEDIAQLNLVKFINPQGLEAVGKNLYKETVSSNAPILGVEPGDRTEIYQGYVEMSNVHIVDEMINLITAERAYEINSKAIQTADRMLEIANNLKR